MTTRNESLEQNPTTVRIAISATFVAEPIEAPLRAWMSALGIDATIEFAPFSQVFQQLLNPLSLLFADNAGIKVIFLRFSDWQKRSGQSEATLGGSDDANQVIRSRIDEFVTALSAAIQRCPSTVLVFVCPEDPSKRQNVPVRENLAELAELEDLLVLKTKTLEGVRVVTTREVANLYAVADPFDSSADAMASIPYTPHFYAALGTLVARKVHTLYSHRIKPFFSTAMEPCGTVFAGRMVRRGYGSMAAGDLCRNSSSAKVYKECWFVSAAKITSRTCSQCSIIEKIWS